MARLPFEKDRMSVDVFSNAGEWFPINNLFFIASFENLNSENNMLIIEKKYSQLNVPYGDPPRP